VAIVGDAYIVVRALTDKVEGDIRRGFSGVEGAGRQAGEKMGDAFTRGFNRNTDTANVFSRFSQGLKTMVPEAERARQAWAKLTRVSFVLGPAISLLVGGIGALIGGLGALVGSAGGAAASLVIIGNGFVALRLGALAAKLALGGVGRALSQLNNSVGGGSALADNARQIAEAERALALVIENNRERLVDANNDVRQAQLDLNEAFKEGREEIQQLGFEAEDAALAEQQAAIDLTKAREILARVQDLPPNSRVRKEAELAYQEAELNLRKAKDRSADLNKEQDRLARTGVSGTAAVVNATQRLAQAEANKAKVVRDSIRDQISAEESLANARDNTASAGGGADPFAGLNAAQIQFVKNLQSLKPLLDDLKASVAGAFLPPLWEAISLLANKAFPTIKNGMTEVAAAMGNAAISIAEAVTEAENLADLQTIFSSSATLIEGLGRVLGNVWDAATSVLAAASPLAERFVTFLETKTGSLAKFLDAKQASGELETFFNRAGDIMADIGEIFGNVFQGFGKLIEANFGPDSGGQYLLDWLKTATDKFANLDTLAGGSDKLSKYFEGAATNTQKVLSSIGALLKEFIKLGDDPNIGKAFDKLAEGAPIIGNLAEKFVKAAPEAAALLVNIIGIIDKFTDTASVEIFFNILTTAVEAVNTLLQNEFIANLVAAIGIITSVGLAFGTIFKVGKLAFEGIVGAISLASGNLGTLTGAAGNAAGALGSGAKGLGGIAGGLGTFFAGPWGLALAAAATAVTLFIYEIEKGVPSAQKISTALTQAKDAATLLKVATERSQTEQFFWGNYAESLKDLGGLMDQVTNDAVLDWLNLSRNELGALDSLNRVGDGLGTLASTNLPAAQESFRGLAEQYALTNEQQLKLLGSMPGYKEELLKQAEALGIDVTNLSEAERNQRLLELAMGDGTGVADSQNAAIKALADSIIAYTNTAVAATNSEIAFQSAIDNNAAAVQKAKDEFLLANGTLDGFKMSLDINDEAGRRNTKMLTDLAGSTSRLYEDTLAQTGSQEEANKKLEDGRKALYDQAIQMGATADEAQALTDKYLATPKTVETKANYNDADAKKKQDELTKDKTHNITSRINATKGSGWFGELWKTITGQANAVGGMYNYGGGGGVVKAFANGGMAPGIFSGSQGPLYKFAEPETRWEAFISGKRGQEKRNIEIWKEAGKRLGVLGTENANGNIYGTGKTGTMGGSANYNNISITVNPAPGMDERELAAAVSREISFQMRRGAVA
jgi:hypothetical protein